MIEEAVYKPLLQSGILGTLLLIAIIFIYHLWRELNERHYTTVKLVEKNTEAMVGMKETIHHLAEFLRGRTNP